MALDVGWKKLGATANRWQDCRRQVRFARLLETPPFIAGKIQLETSFSWFGQLSLRRTVALL